MRNNIRNSLIFIRLLQIIPLIILFLFLYFNIDNSNPVLFGITLVIIIIYYLIISLYGILTEYSLFKIKIIKSKYGKYLLLSKVMSGSVRYKIYNNKYLFLPVSISSEIYYYDLDDFKDVIKDSLEIDYIKNNGEKNKINLSNWDGVVGEKDFKRENRINEILK